MELTLGRLVATAMVAELAAENHDFSKHVWQSLTRYLNFDWGDLCDEDKDLNRIALGPDGGRIFAAYDHPDHEDWRIWIITEADRSVTTVLFPCEY
ncbi:MAG: hypothetical protein FWB76_00160 [Oscillospiraceae bacterium]|nr:hypothetical protein [Oscillospiraceae bacterium]